MSKNFQPLSSGEVLSVNSDSQIVIGHGTFRVGEFTTALKQLMLEHGVGGITPDNVDWLTADGVDCDVLRFGSNGWVKGKVRLHLEFSEEGNGEASPDPKTEAAIETIAPVAAIASPESDVASPEALDFGEEFDLAEPATESPEPLVEAPATHSKETITSKDTFVQSEEDTFDDLFGDEELVEDIGDVDDSFDDLLAADDAPEEDVIIATPEAADDDAFDDLLFDDEDNLFTEPVVDEAAQESGDDLDLGLDDELIDLDDDLALGSDDEPTEVEAIATDNTPELDDDLDDLFADSTDAELEDSDDDLGFDDLDLAEATAESDEDGGDDDLGIDDLMLEEDSETDDDLLTDPFDELDTSDGDAAASDDDGLSFSSAEELTEDSEIEAVSEDLSADDDADFSFNELGEDDADFDLGDLDTEDVEMPSEETPAAELDDLDFDLGDLDAEDVELALEETPEVGLDSDDALGLGDDASDDFSFDALTDEDEPDFDLDALGGDEAALSSEETPITTGLEADALGLGDDESDDFSFDALADGDDPDFNLDSDVPSLDELSAEAGEFGLAGDDNADFSFIETTNEDADEMDGLFGDLGESTSGSLGGEMAEAEASSDEEMSFDNPFEESVDDEDSDLTQDELPPEIDFGSTEDLGEFIDVSMFRKKPASTPDASADSPFDELGDSKISTDDDEDISLGDLFNETEDGGFNLDELDSGNSSGDRDPLDAVTGEEEEVSADIWDLE